MAANSSSLAAITMGMQGLSAASSAYSQSVAARTQGMYQESMYNSNARLAQIQEKDAERRGDKDAIEVKRQTKKLIGAQRAAYAAQGIDVGDGSAIEVQEDTDLMGELDALTVKNNAFREAWGLRTEADNYAGAARFARSAADFNSRSTLLTGGLQALGYGLGAYREYKKR